ncbi:MAG TPA: transglutaminaseTgpA domain-containing protein [Acidimicrobiia bacterium]|nr:transglutaminaseTgpA domain-containing protein [Acidimicrobiia bacterium]
MSAPDVSSSESPGRARKVAPVFRIVAIPAAVALGSVGGIAAEHGGLPWITGAVAGAVAAVLGVLALPSIPTRRATVVLLGLGGLAALRHSSFAGADRSWLLLLWAAATMLTLVFVDRADAETVPALADGVPIARRWPELARVGGVIALVVVVVAVAFVPTVTARLGRHVWPGALPSGGDIDGAPSSLRTSSQLSLTSRPRLSGAVVFTVDASHPDFWRGETFDEYHGSNWSNSRPGRVDDSLAHDDGNRVNVAPALYDVGAQSGAEFRQTFHVETGYTEVVFAAPSPRVVETDRVLNRRSDGTVQVAGSSGFGKGAVYTVISRSLPVTEAKLRAADASAIPEPVLQQYVQSANSKATTARVAALARSITAGATNTFDKVRAIETWMGENLQYSLNAPLSPPGDVVADFLFHTRVGWCEQIASSLVVLARSIGIPARLATGFAPGARDSLTGRFVVRERDAHAWAEIYFAGIGWQGFDPTAAVPLAGDAKAGGSWLADARHNAIPLTIAVVLLGLAVFAAPQLVAASRRRRARKASWSAGALHRLERAGRKAGRARAPSETPHEYARALADRLGDDRLDAVGATLDAALYSAHGASEADRADADAVLTSIRP